MTYDWSELRRTAQAAPSEEFVEALESLDVLPEAWRPEGVGDALVGKLVDVRRGVSQYGVFDVAVIRDGEEREWGLWLSSQGLRQQWDELQPRVGERVGVKYLGEQQSAARRTYKLWGVLVDRPEEPVG